MASRTLLALALGGLSMLAGCGEEAPDAYGNFEATEVAVSAEAAGRLLRFGAVEGARLPAGAEVGLIDTTALGLQRRELQSQLGATRTRTTEAEAQAGVLRAQLATARAEHERTLRLFREEAATAQQLDRAEGEVRVLERRIAAARAGTGVARQETGGVEARLAQIDDAIARSRIENPVPGTVLATYVETGELVQRGQPLYTIAALDTLTLRAYVAGAQLAAVQLGGAVQVQVDVGADERRTMPGRVSWIAAEAEFTPTPIQTRDERTEQVYAVKVRVPNPDGLLKIGMPGELVLPADSGDAP